MDAIQEERRGEEAQILLGNALYKESWREVRERLITLLEQPGIKPDEREQLNNALVGLRAARRYLEQVVTTGTMSAMETQRKRTLADRMLRRA